MKKNKIQLNIPNLIGNEWKYLKKCIDTNWISTAGKFVDTFEKKISKITKAKYAIACINGTAALQISLKIAGVKSNDEVIVPSITFVAPINAVVYNNAKPIFMDVDKYFNIDPEKTYEFIKNNTYYKNGFSYNKKTKNRISAIIPVHVWGNAANLKKLSSICKKKNIKIIEDASESLGTFYKLGKFKQKHTGTIGDFGCISFNGNKIVTSGGGGVILTNSRIFAKKARYLITQAKDDPIKFVHNEIGYNYKLTNIQAGIGLAQLENISFFLKRKKAIFNYYKKNIKKSNFFKIAETPSYSQNNYWMSILEIVNIKKFSVKEILFKMKKNNIECRPVWYLNNNQKPYKNCETYKIVNANKKIKNSICLPSGTSLSNKELKKIVQVINTF